MSNAFPDQKGPANTYCFDVVCFAFFLDGPSIVSCCFCIGLTDIFSILCGYYFTEKSVGISKDIRDLVQDAILKTLPSGISDIAVEFLNISYYAIMLIECSIIFEYKYDEKSHLFPVF